MTIADSVWLATALLHRENSQASDFSVQEIIQKSLATRHESYSPGLPVFTSKHCVANKAPNSLRYRILVETTRGRRRLFRTGDSFHPDRQNGKVRPDKKDLPSEFQPLVDWYDEVYSKEAGTSSRTLPEAAVPHQFPVALNSGDSALTGLDGIRSETAFMGPGGTIALPQYLRQELGLKEGACLSIYREGDHVVLLPITDDFIRKVRGSLKGYDLLADREREHIIEKRR